MLGRCVVSQTGGGITYDVVSLLHVGEYTYIDALARVQLVQQPKGRRYSDDKVYFSGSVLI